MLNIEFASSLGQGLWQFVSYMGLAIFAENVILARALGVTRLMKLVPDHKAQVWDLCLPLIWVMTLSAPLGWAAHNLLFPWLRTRLPAWLPVSALRPVVYLTCGVAAMAVTWLVALGSNLSALWILVANGWMQNPIASDFNFETMRMEMVSFSELVLNPVAQVKFVHTVASGYVTGAMFILAISSWYMLKGRDFAFAKRSFAIAASFGMAAILSVIVLGDESGYEMGDVQKTKLAAIEAEWETQPAPAAFTLFGIPDQNAQTNHFAIQIPYALGIIATRSVDKPVIGLKDLMVQHEERIRNGMKAYALLEQLRAGSTDQAVRDQFNNVKKDLGYGLLLKRYTPNVADATEEQIAKATKDSIPSVAPLYFAFRIMVACGILMLLIIGASFWSVIRNRIGEKKWLLRAAFYGLPLPWIAVESGWFVAEYGRQPWAIGEVLPTAVANSSLTAGDLIFSMLLICGLYTLFLVAELFLMFKFARKGPSSLKTGRYHFEQSSAAIQSAR